MTERPIIFSTPMVLALLDGRKTQTRRYLPNRIQVGDHLWVRESIQRFNRTPPTAQYVATTTGVVALPGLPRHPNGAALWPSHWQRDKAPSIHMPRWASRMTLVVTNVRVQSLQDIDADDAMAEGVENRQRFARLWRNIHGDTAWDENREVAAITFRVEHRNIDIRRAAA